MLCVKKIVDNKKKMFFCFSVATVMEVSKMTVPIYTSHWCLVMSFWLKVCIYSHTRGV